MPNNDLISRKYIIKELLKEREKFPAMVEERYSFGVKIPRKFNQALRGGIRKALRIAETAPAVDAEPSRHGKWIEHYAYGAWHYDCPFCDDGYATKAPEKKPVNYCSNCGAKLDKEKKT